MPHCNKVKEDNNMMPTRRDIRCDLPLGRVRDWHPRGAHVSHFFNALSIFFPLGERFFIASVRAYRDQIDDPELQKAVTAFIGQEAMHGREHEAYNRHLVDSLPVARRLEPVVAASLRAIQKLTPKSWQLATTLALEHHTAILADLLLRKPELLEGADPAFRRLWRWHALEETEHKAVAFDVWNAALGSGRKEQAIRAAAMVWISLGFVSLIAAFTAALAETDPGARRKPRGYLALLRFLFGKGGMYRGTWTAWRDYFARDFHPWQHDNRALLAQADEIVAPVLAQAA